MNVTDLPPVLAAKVRVNPVTGCWEWTGALARSGYGKTGWRGRTMRVHRLAYELLVGPIAAGLDLDHVSALGCRSRLCCNPAHLEPVTHAENNRRGGNAAKTHCPAGHEYTPENTYFDGHGRRCLTCRRKQQRDRMRLVRLGARLAHDPGSPAAADNATSR